MADEPSRRRRHLGVEVTLGVELRPSSGEAVAASTTELRLDGMSLDSPAPLPAGQVVEFRLVGFSLNLDGQARVGECRPGPDGRHRLELSFPPDMSLIERERLARFLAERRRRSSDG